MWEGLSPVYSTECVAPHVICCMPWVQTADGAVEMGAQANSTENPLNISGVEET